MHVFNDFYVNDECQNLHMEVEKHVFNEFREVRL